MSEHGAQVQTHAHDDGEAHGSLAGYLTGFALAVILTAVPFWLVMTGALGDNQITALVIVALAAVQIVVHMVFFLHMGPRVEGGWSLMALLFTLILVVITLAGSLWVMYHLNTNMMPMPDMSQVP